MQVPFCYDNFTMLLFSWSVTKLFIINYLQYVRSLLLVKNAVGKYEIFICIDRAIGKYKIVHHNIDISILQTSTTNKNNCNIFQMTSLEKSSIDSLLFHSLRFDAMLCHSFRNVSRSPFTCQSLHKRNYMEKPREKSAIRMVFL